MTEDGAVEWMTKNGRPGYANEINALEAIKSETIGEAGRYWQFCEFTQEKVRKIEAEIAEVKRAAYDRYDDWVSDPLD